LKKTFDVEVPKKIVFGSRSKYMALFSHSRLAVISLEGAQRGKIVKEYTLDNEKYECISDLNLRIKEQQQ
jgi:hypothetical protein